MRDPLARRFEDGINILESNDEIKSKFDYSAIDENDKEILIEYENQINQNKVFLIRSTIEIGKILEEAQQRLSKYKTGTFMAWYENLGFNKDNVSYFLKRYSLFLRHADKKNYIAELPVYVVKALTKKDTPEELVNEVIEKEITTMKALKEIENKYSQVANIKKQPSESKTKNRNINIDDICTVLQETFIEYNISHDKARQIAETLKYRLGI